MDDTWFEDKKAPGGNVEYGYDPDETKALKDYLENKTSPQEAAQAIMKPTATSADPSVQLSHPWCLLIDALVELPLVKVTKLIRLLKAIEQLDWPNLTKQQKWQPEEEFQDGPWFNFTWNWGDEHSQALCRSIWADSRPTDRDSLRARFVRSAEVEARLAVAAVGGITLDWGYEYIAEALEDPTHAVPEYEIPAVGKWITVAGEQLFAGALEGRETWAFIRVRELGKEAKAMSLDRWSSWVQRMEELYRQQSGATQKAAGAVLQQMKALEARITQPHETAFLASQVQRIDRNQKSKGLAGQGATAEHIEHVY